MTDFTKTFDPVDHAILLHKLSQLSLPGFVFNWICSFLSGRGQQCKTNGLLSGVIDIGLSIVQGSGIGATLYIIIIVYYYRLCSISAINDILSMLMIRHFWFLSTLTLNCMLSSNVKAWAATNCLKLNLSKIKEIVVFKRPRVQYFHMLPAVDDIEQLDCCKLLGVIFQSNFKMDSHIQFIISQCAQRMYPLKLLHHQGLPEARLSVIANAVII